MTDHEHRVGRRFAVIDWLVVAASLLAILTLASVPPLVAPAFARMFADLGGVLPRLTHLALEPWCGPAAALGPLLLVVLAVGPWCRQVGRRVLLVVALAVALVGLAAWWLALYLPIFALAGAVGP